MARTSTTVYNRHRAAVSRGGYTFPARSTRTVDLTPKGVAEVRGCRWLEVRAGDDLDSLKVDELRELARERGLDTSGRKDELIARLSSSDEDEGEGTGEDDSAAQTSSDDG